MSEFYDLVLKTHCNPFSAFPVNETSEIPTINDPCG